MEKEGDEGAVEPWAHAFGKAFDVVDPEGLKSEFGIFHNAFF